ncbi:gamma-glutamyltransferase [Candidatus Mycalebacterium sp.]
MRTDILRVFATTCFVLTVFFFQTPSAVSAAGIVSAANPYAARAAVEILRKGGSAVDAAISAQMVLNLVEPQSSGIGGGGFMLHWDGIAGKLTTFDGRETAPFAISGGLFVREGKPVAWDEAAASGKSVGAPGLIAMLEKAHRKHGNLKWAALFEQAINLSKNGFAVSPRLSAMIEKNRRSGLAKYSAARSYFFRPSGKSVASGSVLKNPNLAESFEAVAKKGARTFHRGRLAHEIAEKVRDAGGFLSVSDLRRYKAVSRNPVCGSYRSYLVCGMGPPTSGGLTVIQILKMLERFNMGSLHPMSARAAHLFTQASRLAYADRDVHIADPDFHPVPVEKLTDSKYLKRRSLLIDERAEKGKMFSGIAGCRARPEGGASELPSTTHISVVDEWGNAVSMTSSIERAFGSGVMAGGFLLNNQLTDFSFSEFGQNGCPIANRVEPGKRPRSSMSPMMVFDRNGELVLIIGSPGGSRIISYVTQTIVAVLDWGLDIQKAVSLGHYVNRNGETEIETGTEAESLAPALEKLGHKVRITELESGLHGIEFTPDGVRGGADPRREGVVLRTD